MKNKLQQLIDYLEIEYAAAVACCGEDDEINTLPAEAALEIAKEIMAMIS